jgi:cytochrome c553
MRKLGREQVARRRSLNCQQSLFLILIFFSSITAYSADNITVGQKKSILCAACHGENGISINPEWPNLAGQHKRYIIQQLKAFQKGTVRNAPTMTAVVPNLTNQDIKDLAEYYAKLPSAKNDLPFRDLKRGEQLYRQGDFKKHITACIACHGPQGNGNEQAGFPALSGQNSAYTVQQLLAFKTTRRQTDLNSIMRDISARMDEDDMHAVADYIANLK